MAPPRSATSSPFATSTTTPSIRRQPGEQGTKKRPYADAKKYNDFRKMLDEMGKNIDAVTVSTPDHTHAPASIMAMKMKKHVYCQKPLTHTVCEARKMREVAKEIGVATQMGNQGSAENGLRRAVELVQAGPIGPVQRSPRLDESSDLAASPDDLMARRRPRSRIARYLHWEEWIGTGPHAALLRNIPRAGARAPTTDFNWRGWWDFGTGALGDMACHTANMAFRALKLGYPTSIVAEATAT